MSREAMKLALEALESDPITHAGLVSRKQAITALRQALETEQEPVGDDRVMTVVYRNVQKEDAQSFTDHPKAVWFGWCHAPYQRDDAIFKLEKAITSPPASKPWVGLTDEEIDYQAKKDDHAVYFALGALWAEAKLKEKNHG